MALSRSVEALSGMYGGNVVPLRDLKVISDKFAVDVVDATHKTRNGNITPAQGVKSMSAALAEIDRLWPKYAVSVVEPAEKALVLEVEPALKIARKATLKAIELAEKNDLAGLAAFTTADLYPAIDPCTDIISKLIDLQLDQSRARFEATERADSSAKKLLIVVSLIAIILSLAACVYVVLGLARPLRGAILTMNRIAEDDLTVEITGETRRDEIGAMARALLHFKASGLERHKLRLAAEEEQRTRLARSARVESAVREFEQASLGIITTVATASTELEASATMMMEIAKSASEQSSMVAAASHQASTSMQSLVSNGDELASSINEIGRQAKQSSNYAAAAAEKARETDKTVQKLNDAGRAIVEVVDLIKSIASQTNLLALNATIEAARAGESGRGFAVVAAEVKALAGQTSKATDVIAEHVGAIQAASSESIAAMREISRMIEEINRVASSIAVAVTEQSAATEGISENVQQVAQGTASASESISIVNQAATNTGAAAGQVLSASQELAEQSQLMREKVDMFLHAVRAA